MTGEEAAETAVSRMLDRIPASLYEVAWQYSLFDWYDSTQSEEIDWDLAPEHLAYLTPRAKSGLFGQEDSLVVVYADLSNPEEPKLRNEEDGGPVEITTYTEEDRFRVGHSYPEGKTSNMTDYSITTHKNKPAHHIAGLRDDAYWTNNVQDRFTDWAQSEFAQAVKGEASDEDAAVLDALAALGDDEGTMDHLADSFLELVESEDEEIDALITVAVKLPEETEYKLPGEVSVLNEVMTAKKADRLDSVSIDNASGEGTGYVTGESDFVTGGSPGLFGMYGKLQLEHFPDLETDGSSAWRSRPVTFDVAAAIAAAGSIFDDFYRGLGNDRRLYVLPYLAARRDDLDPEVFRWFQKNVYKEIQTAERGSDGNFDAVLEKVFVDAMRTDNTTEPAGDDEPSGLLEESTTAYWDEVRFAVVHQVTGNPERVFFDTLDGLAPAIALSNAHNDVTGADDGVFGSDGIFHETPAPTSSPLLERGNNLVRYILYGGYFRRTTEPTRSSREASETPGAGDIDDSRMQRVRNLLTDTQIDVQTLLEEYIHQLVQDQNEQFGNDDDYIAFPKRSVVEQYVQLHALSSAGALDTTNTIQFTTRSMSNDFDSRSDRLDEFIESHDALSGDAEEAVFTLGGLVGRISAYQSYENVSSTLIRRYPVDYLTKQTIKEVTKEVLQMNNSYGEADEKRSYQTNSRYTNRLADTMLAADPSSWRLTEPELQWLYSLGIAYGLNDSSSYEEDEETTTEAEPTA